MFAVPRRGGGRLQPGEVRAGHLHALLRRQRHARVHGRGPVARAAHRQLRRALAVTTPGSAVGLSVHCSITLDTDKSIDNIADRLRQYRAQIIIIWVLLCYPGFRQRNGVIYSNIILALKLANVAFDG